MLHFKKFLFLLSILVPVLLFSQDSNLVLHYTFDGNTNDQSIYRNDGNIINAVPASDFAGNAASAFLFNGTDSYITAGEDQSLVATDGVSIQAQIQALGPGSPNAGGIIVIKEGEYSLARFADGSLRYAIAFSDNWGVHVNTGVHIPLNEKTNVALIYDRFVGEINIYVNCELVYTKEENRIIRDAVLDQHELRIGARQALSQFFFGIIDEVKVYNTGIDQNQLECFLTNTASIANAKQFEIYPNPTSDILNIGTANFKIDKIEITNSVGNMITQIKGQSLSKEISLYNLPAGVYLIHAIEAGTNLRITKKVVKI